MLIITGLMDSKANFDPRASEMGLMELIFGFRGYQLAKHDVTMMDGANLKIDV